MPIPLNLQELGEKQGFEDGWSDAMKGLGKMLRPDVGYGLVDARYLAAYSKSYTDSHKTGVEERIRRQKLRTHRTQQYEFEQTDDQEQEK